MNLFSLGVAWEWEYDADFVQGIERECHALDLSTYQITPVNLAETIRSLDAGAFGFEAFFDRASDAREEFIPLAVRCEQEGIRFINPRVHVEHAIDKATMHIVLKEHGVNVPATIIIPAAAGGTELHLRQEELGALGATFVIKPANTTGGGTGVVLHARTLADVEAARRVNPGDKYLLQEFVAPKDLAGKRAWFRVYSVFGHVLLCWWDDLTHTYSELLPEEEAQFGLSELREIIGVIRRAAKIDFFSSEVAQTPQGRFVVVDYVNEVCDMRLKSKYPNGAPDAVVHRIERLMAEEVERHRRMVRSRDGA